MNTYKKFILILLSFLFVFYLYNLVVWRFFTEDLLTKKYSTGGDLARMGYVPGAKYHRKNVDDLPKLHIEQESYKGERIDLLTIGDSFTNGGGGGRNRYYQDYIATTNNITVMNIEPYKELDFLSLAAIYINNGYLDSLKPRNIIFSSSEKLCVERFSSKINFEVNMPMSRLATMKRMGYRQNIEENALDENTKQYGFINEGNFKFPLYSLYYHFSDNAFFSRAYKVALKKPLFSVNESNKLLYYRDDIRKISSASQVAMEQVNKNLNTLADKLAKKGIKLYFMPCVDKYNLYSEFIVNNRYPQSTFFEKLRPLPKRYTLIDTKAILLEEVRSGVKDVFYADDTHWSWKASEKIFTAIRFPREP